MKTLSIIAATLLMSFITNAQNKGDLIISFEDLENSKGEIYIALYEKDNFLRQPTKTNILEVKADNNQVTLNDVTYGEYAISVFQDLNGNKQFDMKDNQMPAEPWAMSGNVNPMQMPTWNDAKFTFDTASKTIPLKL
ncbi:DUF2141 domain-containing protein [Mesohalobacter halotolerans]|jgi:uncharacterized protein (DUF2141 family)|uniref:DUF2141 domain-containing protein n=1 Tax=Mesohalobacter halotolerans TaxID=1883405 RepID=A0A4U5TTM6_9FLAO|nr:DUF2141 domain-containing protein [Mesohalobacter halotolerans]MBS3738200.1 DUF2141 domain-containing protein [Psychroflexus sp.]NBC58428.1 DUF2141 domain-containing protein [Bacteroidota bacterium]TKS57503.1 DUF2141 domain-containing protein [Mesohalobacter halotolerans]